MQEDDNAFVEPPILVVDYNPEWPKMYEDAAAQLREHIADIPHHMEHFGSTAILGIAAKPIIDIMVVVKELAPYRERFVQALRGLGYEGLYGDTFPDRLQYARRREGDGMRTHHVHVVQEYSDWRRRLAFRDYLRKHRDEAIRYERLKRKLAAKFGNDFQGYTEAKKDFINTLIQWALDNPD